MGRVLTMAAKTPLYQMCVHQGSVAHQGSEAGFI